MFDYENADLAIVKALSKSPLTVDEIEQILDADRKYFMVEQGLDFVQTSDVKKWAKSEAQRLRASEIGKPHELEEGIGKLGKILSEEDLGRLLDYGEIKSDSKEGLMAKQDLYKMAEYSTKLHEMLQDGDDLPEWCLKYIYLSSAALSKVYHYLDYKIFRKA